MGYTANEYAVLNQALIDQHDNNISDFVHMQYALSARLAYVLDKDDMLSNIGTITQTGTFSTDEKVSYLGGWLGDAVLLVQNNQPAFTAADYTADLDAENVFRQINVGDDSITAINEYYETLSVGNNNRATIFKGYISYSYAKERVYYDLIDDRLLYLMNIASNNGDIVSVAYYAELLDNEEYHMNILRTDYPDAYDFLMSLDDGLAFMASY